MTMIEGVRASGQIAGQVTDVDGRTVDVEIPYNVVDTYGTVWLPGCFTRSLQRKLPPVLMHHDTKILVGRVTGYRDTPTAMQMTIRLADPNAVPDARAAQSLLREGVIDGVSFFYNLDEPRQQNVTLQRSRFGGAPCFRSVTLNEVSFVTIPSVPGARVLAVRSAAIDEELTPEELDEIERMIAVGYPPAELSVMRSRQDLNLDVRVRDALAKLDGRRRCSTALTDADLRRRAAALPPRVDPEKQAARQMELRRQWDGYVADDHLMSTPQGRRIVSDRYAPDAPSYVPPPPDPAAPPGEDLALIAQEAHERGENVGEAVRAADANWRAKYGALYASTVPLSNEPNARGDRPYPPDDVLEIAALSAGDRGISSRQAVDEAIRNWRTARGFE